MHPPPHINQQSQAPASDTGRTPLGLPNRGRESNGSWANYGAAQAGVITAIIADARRRPVAEPSVVAAAKPPGLVVVMPANDWVCARCAGTGDLADDGRGGTALHDLR